MSNTDMSDSIELSDEELELLSYLLEQEGLDLPKPQTIFPRDQQAVLPLSFAQERLWFLDQWDPGMATYNVPASIRLVGQLDLRALLHGLNEVIRRHEALRTTFLAINGQPTQVIAPNFALHLPLLDLQALPEALRERAALRLLNDGSRQPFDLAVGPLVRILLIRLNAAEHAFLLNMHHIVCDGWSMAIFIQELAALYRAFALGQPSPLPDLAIQYADFAIWQREWLQGEVLEAQLSYWQQQLGGRFPVLDLPTDRPRPPVQTHHGARESIVIAASTVAALKTLCQEEGATLFMALLAGFSVLLARYSGQTDIIVGAPIANRDLFEIEPLIGYFVNTLVLRMDLARPASFRELLQRVRGTTLDAHAHQNIPFEQLVEKLQSERDPSRTPLFQVMFVLQNTPPAVYELPDLTMKPITVETGTAKFDLLLGLSETARGLVGGIEYNSDLFDATTIRRMLDHFQNLLRHAAADPSQRVAQLPLMSEAERAQILVAWNRTDAGGLDDGSVEQLIAGQAMERPDAVALVWGDRHLSYRQLDDRAGRLAARLRARGVGPETLVGLSAQRSIELIVGLLGVLKAGGAYLPLDPAYPAERITFMLDDSGARVLVTTTQQGDTETRTQGDKEIAQLDVSLSPGLLVSRALLDVSVSACLGSLAYVIYTSGSTGAPKGVLVTRQGLVNHCRAAIGCYELSAEDRVLQLASLNFDLAAEEIYPTLASGAKLVLWPHQGAAAPHEFLDLAERERLTVLDLATPLWQAWATEQAGTGLRIPAALRLVIVGGDRALAEQYSAWRRTLPDQVRWINSYGPTEATIIATIYEPDAGASTQPWGGMPIGRPIANIRIYLLDAQMQPVPIGVPGELHIGGAGLARGYIGRPDLTAAAFLPNPFAEVSGARYQVSGVEPSDTRHPIPDIRLYKTGDLARYRPDGVIEFLGRIDRQVKVRGYRIELGEIEAVLHAHAAVRESVVLAREDIPGDQRLVAYVVPHQRSEGRDQGSGSEDKQTSRQEDSKTGRQGDTENPNVSLSAPQPPTTDSRPLVPELRTFLSEKLPGYMLPATFMFLDSFPLTPNGKIDRAALPAPQGKQAATNQAYVAPRTPLEATIAELTQQVLGLAQVGIHDNFFALGGHSLLATRLVVRLRERFAIELPLRSLFGAPTVAGLAEHVEALQWAAQEPLVLADDLAEELQEGEL